MMMMKIKLSDMLLKYFCLLFQTSVFSELQKKKIFIIYLFIYSFIRLFIRAFIRSFARTYVFSLQTETLNQIHASLPTNLNTRNQACMRNYVSVKVHARAEVRSCAYLKR